MKYLITRHVFNLLVLPFGIFATVIGCERPTQVESKHIVKVQLPNRSQLLNKLESATVALPTDRALCFGVNIKAVDLPDKVATGGVCTAVLGTYAGFGSEGEILTIEVKKGTSRNFELYMYLANPGAICPNFNVEFFNGPSNYLNTYLVGKTPNINLVKDTEIVEFSLDYKGLTQNLAADAGKTSCEQVVAPTPIVTHGTAKLRGLLYSDGSILAAGESTPLLSLDVIESFSIIIDEIFDLLNIQVVTQASVSMNNLAYVNDSSLSPYLYSFTRAPGTNLIFALNHDGSILQFNSGTGLAEQPVTCPFDSCQLPLWVQSISAGYEGELFALDHSGQIYAVTAAGLIPLVDAVEPTVTQVLYY